MLRPEGAGAAVSRSLAKGFGGFSGSEGLGGLRGLKGFRV